MKKHRTALVLFAVALGVVVAVASVTTLEHVNTHKVKRCHAGHDRACEAAFTARPRIGRTNTERSVAALQGAAAPSDLLRSERETE